MISAAFLKRLEATNKVAVAMRVADVDVVLSAALLKTLKQSNLYDAFLSGPEFSGPEVREDEAWLAAAALLFGECGGPTMPTTGLAAFVQRITELGFVPFAQPFADRLIAMAERDGWVKTLAGACNVPEPIVATLLRGWDSTDDPLKRALESELEFHRNDEWQVGH